jgi:hypothetical protein
MTKPIYLEAGLAARLEEFAKRYAVSEDRSELVERLIETAITEVERGGAVPASLSLGRGVESLGESRSREESRRCCEAPQGKSMSALEEQVEKMRVNLMEETKRIRGESMSRIASAGKIKEALEVLTAIHSYFVEFGCALHPSAPLRENDPRPAEQCVRESIALLENEVFQLLSGPPGER